MTPVRFVVATYNIWGVNRWPEREEALRGFLTDVRPDILALQEFRPETRDVIDEELHDFERVDDPFEGWTREGNIYWYKGLFEKVEHGAEDIGILEPLRRLFWVRLRIVGTGRTIVVATAHYTWVGHKVERETHVNPRVAQAEKTIEALGRLVPPDEPLIFMGDLNESNNAIKKLREGGLTDCWRGRGTYPPPTHPAFPTAKGAPAVLDWQLYRGPLRPMVCEVVDYAKGDLAPSDHKPVLVAYSLEPENADQAQSD